MNIFGRNWCSLLLAASLACLTLCSCAVIDWFGGKISDDEVSDMDRDISGMTAKKTRYDAALKRFGKMLDAYNMAPVRVQSKIISNQTADKGLPDDISRMLISSVNKIGPRVVYLPYDPNYVISEASTGGNINRALPQIVIAGGITEFDKDMIEKQRELRAEAQVQEGDFGSNYSHDGGLGYTAGGAVSRITVDVQLLDYQTQAYLSGIQAINSVNLRKSKLGWSVGYYFQGIGGGFDYSLSQQQGKYHAIRLLVELSVLEILGKFFDVPYWRCIDQFPPDTSMIKRLTEEFADLSYTDQNAYLEEYLFFHGYSQVDRDGKTQNEQDLAAIADAMKKFKCNDRVQLFIKLWESVPIDKARERNRKHSREIARLEQLKNNEYLANVQKYNTMIATADELVNNDKLAQARVYYEQALALFPDQEGPARMIQTIDNMLASNNRVSGTPSATNVAVNQESANVSVPKSTDSRRSTMIPNNNNAVQRKKETPLSPFQKTEW